MNHWWDLQGMDEETCPLVVPDLKRLGHSPVSAEAPNRLTLHFLQTTEINKVKQRGLK